MDFTLKSYKTLLNALQVHGFSFRTFQESLKNSKHKSIIFRHDIDRLPENSITTARLEHSLGICGTYYFRTVPQSFNPEIIKEIASLGHEIGYHYEDLSFSWAKLKAKGKGQRAKGSKKYGVGSKEYEEFEKQLVNIAIESFKENLDKLRQIIPVKTICMHGSPMSSWDSRLLWKYYDYKDFGIVGEPYFDVNMEEMLYLTDTGRRWNGGGVSVRDKTQDTRHKAQGKDPFEEWVRKPVPGSLMNMTEKAFQFQSRYNFRSTNDIIRAAKRGELPDKMMMTFHPQRWTDKQLPWVKELVWQNVKNVGKYFLIKIKK